MPLGHMPLTRKYTPDAAMHPDEDLVDLSPLGKSSSSPRLPKCSHKPGTLAQATPILFHNSLNALELNKNNNGFWILGQVHPVFGTHQFLALF